MAESPLSVSAAGRPFAGRAWRLALIAGSCLVLDIALMTVDARPLPADQVGFVVFLAILAVLLSIPRIQLPRGYLSLGAIATNASALLLPTRYAAVVGAVAGLGITLLHRRVSARLVQIITLATGPVCAASVAALGAAGASRWLAEGLALVVATVSALLLTCLVGSAVGNEGPIAIVRRNLSRQWIGAFFYFAIAGYLIAHVLDGHASGYIMAVLVATLALALSDSVAGREVRLKLQAQISDAQRVIAYSRVIEGTIHNLRNHLAAALGHLDEVPMPTDADAASRHVLVAGAAVSDAVELLDQLQAGGKHPRELVAFDLVELAVDACVLLNSRVRQKGIELQLVGAESPLFLTSDPLLVKQIVSNLLLNAIDAVGGDGRVRVEVVRATSAVRVAVEDNGPGVPDKYRGRLFEPHFTTKPNGNGVGLFVSYRIATQLGGDLRYEGSDRGALFVLTLPTGG